MESINTQNAVRPGNSDPITEQFPIDGLINFVKIITNQPVGFFLAAWQSARCRPIALCPLIAEGLPLSGTNKIWEIPDLSLSMLFYIKSA